MTNEQAIEMLSEIRSGYNCFDESERPFYEALSEAIESLSCSEKPNRSDVISRQDAIDTVYTLYDDDCFHESERDIGWNNAINNSVRKLKCLPPAKEESELGENDELVRRQDAIDAIEKNKFSEEYCKEHNIDFSINVSMAKIALESLPSAQPYTDKEIQKIQDLEQAEIQKAYDLGKLDAMEEMPKWIPCSERLPEVHESGNSFSGIYMQSVPVLVYGICEGEENAQFHVATYCDDLDGNTYWSTELDALTITGVIAWMPLPKPYAERRGE